MSRDFRLKKYVALSKRVFIPVLFLLVCFTFPSSLVFKLSKSFIPFIDSFPFIAIKIPDIFKVRFLDSFHFSIAKVAPEVAS